MSKCKHDEKLAEESKAWKVLIEANNELGVMDMARERAACGEWPQPETPGDYLAWIEDEATIQEEQAAAEIDWIPGAFQERMTYANALRTVARKLRSLSVQPAKLFGEVSANDSVS
jgi:hypothetical protein